MVLQMMDRMWEEIKSPVEFEKLEKKLILIKPLFCGSIRLEEVYPVQAVLFEQSVLSWIAGSSFWGPWPPQAVTGLQPRATKLLLVLDNHWFDWCIWYSS